MTKGIRLYSNHDLSVNAFSNATMLTKRAIFAFSDTKDLVKLNALAVRIGDA